MNSVICNINGKMIDLLDKENLFFSFLHTDNRHFLQNKPSNIGLDLLFVGLAVSIADRIVSRDLTLDGWTRDIKIDIPVIEYNKWTGVKNELASALSFLSGDYWDVTFSKRLITDLEKTFCNKSKRIKRSSISINETIDFCMLSGGLDSFIGAIDLLANNVRKTIFVNLHGSGSSFEQNFNDVRNVLCSEFDIDNAKEFF